MCVVTKVNQEVAKVVSNNDMITEKGGRLYIAHISQCTKALNMVVESHRKVINFKSNIHSVLRQG